MGKATGFMDYDRQDKPAEDPKERIKHFKEFHTPLSKEEQELQGARCMACGVPFCQSGQMLMGMASGCPLHNLVPEWNDLLEFWKVFCKVIQDLLTKFGIGIGNMFFDHAL